MRLPGATVAPIVLLWCGTLNFLGCGSVAKGGDGPVDRGAADVGAVEAGVMDAAPTDVDATPMDAVTDSMDVGFDADAGCPAPPVETFTGTMTTVTCPAVATAVDGVVTPTCDFPYSFAPNNVFTGPVTLVSHLDRDFAQFDVSQVANDRFQLMCDYANADGLGIGGIFRFIDASACGATSAADFTCVK